MYSRVLIQHKYCLLNLENLISDLLDDAGNRLKKSKLSSMRQIKQTLRFGRRSDPLMAPTSSGIDGGGEQYEFADNVANNQRARWLPALDDNWFVLIEPGMSAKASR